MTAIHSGSLLSRGICVEPSIRAARGGASTGIGAGVKRPSAQQRSDDADFLCYLPERVNTPLSSSRVIGMGRCEVLPGDSYPLANHPKLYSFGWRSGRTLPEHQVLLLSNAAGEFESHATGRVRLLGDVLLFLFPGEWHRFRPLASGGWTERWISLHGDAFRSGFARGGLSATAPVHSPSNAGRLRAAFDRMIDSTTPGAAACSKTLERACQFVEEAVFQATNVLLSLEEPVTDQEGEIDDEIVRQALEIIWNHEHSPPLGVNDVARQLPVTRRTLDRKFSEVLGRTVLDEINTCRISRAKRLLADTDLLVKAVAYRAGFPSRERLRLAFLSHEGMPPTEYREAVRRERRQNES